MGAAGSRSRGVGGQLPAAPSSSSGADELEARLSRARKLHALDLSRLSRLAALPAEAAALPPLRRVDVSHTAFTALPLPAAAERLDHIDASHCALAGAQPSLAPARALTSLALRGNAALRAADLAPPSFALPGSLRSLAMSGCAGLGEVPRCLRGPAGATLARLERLDLSACGLRALPASLAAVGASLLELALDDNGLASLALIVDAENDGSGGGGGGGGGGSGAAAEPHAAAAVTWAAFLALTTLSVRRNRLECTSLALPEALFAETRLSSLSLGGNAALGAAAVLRLPGCAAFEARRAARISKGRTADGDAAQDLSFCGLDR